MNILQSMAINPILTRPRVASASLEITPPPPDIDVGAGNQTGKSKNDLLSAIVQYIPTEVVLAWVTITGLVEQYTKDIDETGVLWVLFIILAVICPIYLYIFTYDKQKGPAKYQVAVGAVAFPVWVFTLGDPFTSLSWYQPVYGSIVLAVLTLLIVPMGHQIFVKGLGND